MTEENTPERCEEGSDVEYEDIDDSLEVSDTEDIMDNNDEYNDYEGEDISDEDMEAESEEGEGEEEDGKDMGDGEVAKLPGGVLDLSIYDMFRAFKLPYPCLSVDAFTLDDPQHTDSPYSLTFVAGSQADRDQEHRLYLFKSRLLAKKARKKKAESKNTDDDDESSSSESESEEEEADENAGEREKKLKRSCVHCIGLKHKGISNRVRQTKIPSSGSGNLHFVASWSSSGKIHIYNVTDTLAKLNPMNKNTFETDFDTEPVERYKQHNGEGYGLDWCKLNPLKIASGNCSGELHVWELGGNGTEVARKNLTFGRSRASIEDIQWSPAEETVFGTCSTDSSVKIWDCRNLCRCMISVDMAHKSDVNVISWNPHGDPFVVSGGDDKAINVWDLRQMSSTSGRCVPVASFQFHRAPITSVRWNPSESTQFVAASEDGTVSVWDLSLEKETIAEDRIEEKDNKEEGTEEQSSNSNSNNKKKKKRQKHELNKNEVIDDVPAQLLFLHEGQQAHIKEVTWHASVKNLIVSTALDGFHAFIPSNL